MKSTQLHFLLILTIFMFFITACTPAVSPQNDMSEFSTASIESAPSSLQPEISKFSVDELNGFTDDNSRMQILVLDDENLIISYRLGNPADITLGFSHEIYRYNISEKTTTKLYADHFGKEGFIHDVDDYYSPDVEYHGLMNNKMRLTKAADGKFALCFSGRYYIFSGDTLVKTGSVDAPGEIVETMVMSPDLSCYAYRAKNPGTISGYGKYYVTDTETGKKRFEDYFRASDVVFSPDGKKISFKKYGDDNKNTYLGVIDPVTGYWDEINSTPIRNMIIYFLGLHGSGTTRFNISTKSPAPMNIGLRRITASRSTASISPTVQLRRITRLTPTKIFITPKSIMKFLTAIYILHAPLPKQIDISNYTV